MTIDIDNDIDINKIFLFGSTGMLGNYIYNYFLKVSNLNIKIVKIPFRISKEVISDFITFTAFPSS